jgi:hypothetical protein
MGFTGKGVTVTVLDDGEYTFFHLELHIKKIFLYL